MSLENPLIGFGERARNYHHQAQEHSRRVRIDLALFGGFLVSAAIYQFIESSGLRTDLIPDGYQPTKWTSLLYSGVSLFQALVNEADFRMARAAETEETRFIYDNAARMEILWPRED